MNKKIIVQVSFDQDVFDNESESFYRQISYARKLKEKSSATKLVNITFTRGKHSIFKYDNFLALPIRNSRVFGYVILFIKLLTLNFSNRISVITTQSIHQDATVALLFGRLFDIPVISQFHTNPLVEEYWENKKHCKFFKTISKKLMLFNIKHSKSVRVVSDKIQQDLFKVKDNLKVTVVPVPLSIAKCHSESERDMTLLYIGRIEKEKRLDIWLAVAEKVYKVMPEINFKIIGDGTLLDSIKQKAAQQTFFHKIQFLGAVKNSDLWNHYKSAKVLLVTSDFEGYCRVVLEAASYGLPVVASECGISNEILKEGENGFLTRRGDIEEMAKKVLAIFQDDNLWRKTSTSARALAEKVNDPELYRDKWCTLLLQEADNSCSYLLPPKKCTLKRLFYLSRSKFSICRSLQYEALSELSLEGKVLDLGGYQNADYLKLIRNIKDVTSVNINPKLKPTLLADLNQPLPYQDEGFDHVISLNTFEHVYNDKLMLKEAIRVLKKGGSFFVTIPFIYRVHGSPSDFHRHTHHYWYQSLLDLGITSSSIKIEPLVWSRTATAFSLVDGSLIKRLIRPFALLPGLFKDSFERAERITGVRKIESRSDYAVGFIIRATK